MDELAVLLDQLEELLEEELEDPDEAVELATLAALAVRLGATPEALQAVDAWLEEGGGALLAEGWDEVDVGAVVDAVETAAGGGGEETLEDALYEFDELVAAAVWSEREELVLAQSARLAEAIKRRPEAYRDVVDLGHHAWQLDAVRNAPEVYAFWRALADLGAT